MDAICLVMIVKDEAHVLARCLASVRPLITRWCIVDTGSSDETEAVAKTSLEGIPGRYEHRSWQGFGASRTEALLIAQDGAAPHEYALVIDADDELVLSTEPAQVLSQLATRADGYLVQIALENLRYRRVQLLKLDRGWRYEGVLHEYAVCERPKVLEPLNGVLYQCMRDGARSRLPDEEKYRRDAETLERALETETDNARYVFYAAQSWRDAENPTRALEFYKRRALMTNGFYEEIFISLLEIARLHEDLKADEEVIWSAYLRAHIERPARAEPLHDLARFCRLQSRYALAWIFASAGVTLARPHDSLFIESDVYEWRMRDEYALAAYHTGRRAIALTINEALLASPELPPEQHARIRANICWTKYGQPTPPPSTQSSTAENIVPPDSDDIPNESEPTPS